MHRTVVALLASLLAATILLAAGKSSATGVTATPTFYRDVLPIFQAHCQRCHRQGEIGPMPLTAYHPARVKAAAIRDRVQKRIMPPWFANPCCGHFANDPSLTDAQIATISDWVAAGTPAGDPHDAPPAPAWTPGWN